VNLGCGATYRLQLVHRRIPNRPALLTSESVSSCTVVQFLGTQVPGPEPRPTEMSRPHAGKHNEQHHGMGCPGGYNWNLRCPCGFDGPAEQKLGEILQIKKIRIAITIVRSKHSIKPDVG